MIDTKCVSFRGLLLGAYVISVVLKGIQSECFIYSNSWFRWKNDQIDWHKLFHKWWYFLYWIFFLWLVYFLSAISCVWIILKFSLHITLLIFCLDYDCQLFKDLLHLFEMRNSWVINQCYKGFVHHLIIGLLQSSQSFPKMQNLSAQEIGFFRTKGLYIKISSRA